jgi:1-acyl-sn-glycerol-3-phosphate acyltransferase
MKRTLASWILSLFGWRIVGGIPPDLKKYVLIAAPHTSWWDFPLGILVRTAIGRKIYFLGKRALFKPPLGIFFRWMGGYPVNRSRSSNLVDQMTVAFQNREEFGIALAPEGTRKKVDTLKTGFYYIAKGANVPIVMVRFDYGNRKAEFSKPFWPGDNTDKDLAFVLEYFKGVKGKIPEQSIT